MTQQNESCVYNSEDMLYIKYQFSVSQTTQSAYILSAFQLYVML